MLRIWKKNRHRKSAKVLVYFWFIFEINHISLKSFGHSTSILEANLLYGPVCQSLTQSVRCRALSSSLSHGCNRFFLRSKSNNSTLHNLSVCLSYLLICLYVSLYVYFLIFLYCFGTMDSLSLLSLGNASKCTVVDRSYRMFQNNLGPCLKRQYWTY